MHIRPYRGADEPALLDIWHESMAHDRIDEARFRTKVLLDPNFQPANLPVASIDGRLAGFALAMTRQVPQFLQGLEPESAWLTAFGVRPDARRQGVGRALFKYLIDRMAGQGRRHIDISPYTPNYFTPGVDIEAYPDTLAFLHTLGFETLYHAISMGANLTGYRIVPEVTELEQRLEREDGIIVAPVTAADLPDLMPFIVEHFGWDWFRHAQVYLLEYFGGSAEPICFLVARRRGEIVGYCQQRGERFGPFGVHPAYRGRGIGRVLLFRCLARMSALHIYYAYFLWTSERTARLYRLAGFETMRKFAVLRKRIDLS